MRRYHGLCNVSIMVEYKRLAVGCQVHVVDHLKLLDLVPLKGRHVQAEPLQDLLLRHGKAKVAQGSVVINGVIVLCGK